MKNIWLNLYFSFFIIYLSQASDLWQDPEALKPYETAIGFIQKNLKKSAKEKGQALDTYEANLVYNRTPRYLFLETVLFQDNQEKFLKLYTPFGGIDLSNPMFGLTDIAYSKAFMDKMQPFWHLVDVTTQVKAYDFCYSQEGNERKFEEKWIQDQGWQLKMYLIQSVNQHIFLAEAQVRNTPLKVYKQVIMDIEIT